MVEPGSHGVRGIAPGRNAISRRRPPLVTRVWCGAGASIVIILVNLSAPSFPGDLASPRPRQVTGVAVIDVILRPGGAIGDGRGIELSLAIRGQVITLHSRSREGLGREDGCGGRCGGDQILLTSEPRPLPLFVDSPPVLFSSPECWGGDQDVSDNTERDQNCQGYPRRHNHLDTVLMTPSSVRIRRSSLVSRIRLLTTQTLAVRQTL